MGNHIVSFITRHHYILAVFRQRSPKDLLKYLETHFAYNFVMLKRLFEVKNHLRQLVVCEEWDAWREHTSVAGIRCRSIVLDDTFWDTPEALLQVVQPVILMSRLLDGDEPCIGKVYEGIDRMIERILSLESSQTLDGGRRQELSRLVTGRWTEYHSALEAVAFVVDPEFQGKGQETDAEVVQGWEDILRRLVPNGDDRRRVREDLSFY